MEWNHVMDHMDGMDLAKNLEGQQTEWICRVATLDGMDHMDGMDLAKFWANERNGFGRVCDNEWNGVIIWMQWIWPNFVGQLTEWIWSRCDNGGKK